MGRIRKKLLSNEESRRIKWYIAVYIRLSKDDGNDESTSVTNQRKIIKDYITEYFCDEDYVIIDFYVEMITMRLIQLHFKGAKKKPPIKLAFGGFNS